MQARQLIVLGAACAVSLVAAAAGAENGDSAAGWITVVAPRVEREPTREGDELVSLTHRVSYDDLDLVMYADVKELERRIGDSADTACKQLAALTPHAELDTAVCVRRAVSAAMEQADRVVAAANAH